MKKGLYTFIVIFTFFLGIVNICAGPSGSGGTGAGSAGGVSGSGSWDEKFGFYIGVYSWNNSQKGGIYKSGYNPVDGWISKIGSSWVSEPKKLYDYLSIPYDGKTNNYSNLLNIIQGRGITLEKGDYIIVEPYTKIGKQDLTFRDIALNDRTYQNYNAAAIILANAAKVGSTIEVGGNTYTKATDSCTKKDGNVIYYKNSACGLKNNHYVGYGLTVISYDDIFKNGKLSITKTNSSGKAIINNSATFQVFSDSSCQTPVSGLIYTNTAGNATIELGAGTYYLKEIKAPKSYAINNECKAFTIEADKTKSLSIENKQTCDSEFEGLKQDGLQYDKWRRIEIFNKYANKGKYFYQLLNFNNVDNPCSNVRNCGTDISGKPNTKSSCTNTNINYNLFNENDVSCYSETQTISDKTAYCVVEYNYDSSFLNTYNKSSFINAGRIVFQDLENLGTGYLQKRCYAYDTNIGAGILDNITFSNDFRYSNYIKNLSILDQDLATNISNIQYIHDTYSEFIGRYNLVYSKVNYIKKISGLLSDKTCGNDCIKVNGLITRFELEKDENDNYKLDFNPKVTLTDGYKTKLGVDKLTNNDNSCKYTFNKQIIKNNKPNLEFRIIDTKNPFPGKTGNGRTIGSNWCDGNIPCTSEGIENYNSLTKIQDIIINKPNGSGINPNGTKATPKYIIDLNYKTIKDIREYNKNHALDSFEQECDNNGENCKSVFLMTFATKNE